jgi:hypothetical protein
MTDSGGVKWFVYAEPGVQCLRGTTAWGTRGCVGAYSDLVGLNQWVKVELVSYGQGFWIARLYDTKGLGHDVAKIWSNSLTIYRGMDVSEEGWWTSTDQYLTMAYYHWHPKYMVWGQGFRDWMDGNYLFTSPGSLCASHYGAWVTLAGDPHYWWAGNGGPTCYVQYLF